MGTLEIDSAPVPAWGLEWLDITREQGLTWALTTSTRGRNEHEDPPHPPQIPSDAMFFLSESQRRIPGPVLDRGNRSGDRILESCCIRMVGRRKSPRSYTRQIADSVKIGGEELFRLDRRIQLIWNSGEGTSGCSMLKKDPPWQFLEFLKIQRFVSSHRKDSPACGSDTLWSRCRARWLIGGAFLYGRMHCCLVQPIAESRQIHDNVISTNVIKFMIKRQRNYLGKYLFI